MIIHLNDNGEEVDKNFAAGEKLGPQPRFHAGLLSTRTALPQDWRQSCSGRLRDAELVYFE